MDAFGTYVEGRVISRGCGESMASTRFRSCPLAEQTSPGLGAVIAAHRRDGADREQPSALHWEARDVVAQASSERLAKEAQRGRD